MLREYKDEITRLRELLEAAAKGLPVTLPAASSAAAAPLVAVSTTIPPGMAVPPGMTADEPLLVAPPGMAMPPGMEAPPEMRAAPPVAVVEKEVVIVERERVVEVEVLPKGHLQSKQAMEEYNQSIVEQRNRLGEELLKRDGAVQAALAERAALEAKLEAIKAKVVHGFGQGGPDEGTLEVKLARKERERRKTQAKLRAKKLRETQLEQERLQAETDKKEAEGELKNAREEAESNERRQVRRTLSSART
jgi:kinesin family protein 3/17